MGAFQDFLGDCIAHCTKRHLHVAVWYLSIVLIIYAPPSKAQATFQYIAGYDFATNNAWSTFYNSDTQQCYSPTCTVMPASGAQVSSSSYAVGQKINMWNLADGEVISWRFTTPTGGVKTIGILTYNKSTDCFIDSEHYQYCGSGDRIGFTYIGVVNSCSQPWSLVEVGPWSISTYDGSTLLYTNSFQVSHDSSGFLGVTFPADNQLIQLDKGHYNATDTLTFQAGTNTGAPIDWEIKLHYQSSGGYPNPPTDALLTFEGTTHSYSGFQAMGGQMTVTAQTGAADNSTVEDCVTAYVEGPETGIPNATITARLDQLYPASTSYNQYLNDGTATPNLLTGVAMHESSYQQFQTPAESNPNPDLFNLYANFKIAAKWPKENFETQYAPRGAYIGLMQVSTTESDAWDWTANTQSGVDLFSGGSSTDKIQTAVRYEGYIINGYSYTVGRQKISLPPHINGDGSHLRAMTGLERENNALVIYGGDLSKCSAGDYSCIVNSLYYVPQCPPPGVQSTDKHGNLVCQGGTWEWVTNSANQPNGVSYADNVRSDLQ